jgi:predicted kinase
VTVDMSRLDVDLDVLQQRIADLADDRADRSADRLKAFLAPTEPRTCTPEEGS